VSVSANVPEELYEEARRIADAKRISVDEVVASALADQFALRRLRERACRGGRHKLLAVLEKVDDVEPEEYDRLTEAQGRLPLV
jgi:hypothetical protein